MFESDEIFKTTSTILQEYLKPKLIEFLGRVDDSIKSKKEVVLHDVYKNKFRSYLESKVSNFLVIDTLVFPNFQTLIGTLYEPLCIKTNYLEIGEFTINGYPKELFDDLHRVLIQDTAGMGKSTISKIMFIDAVKSGVGLPFHIELRKINKTNSIFDEIASQLEIDNTSVEIEFIKKLISRGDFIFILDGYDEIQFDNRELVANYIHELLSIGDNCKFCLTSRPEAGLASFGDFISFEIKGLTEEQAYSLFERLDTYAHKPIKDELVSAVSNSLENGSNIKDFLENPLLVSLLYKTFDFKKNLPDNLSQFYRQIYDALFENHDLSKEGYFKREKYSRLHIDEFEKILRCIGFQTSVNGSNEFSKDVLLEIIIKSQKFFPGIKCKPSDFLKDIISTVPLFKKEGHSYKWSHKSLQDYFAAKFLYSDYPNQRDAILLKFFNEKSNSFLLQIYHSLDSKTFRRVCLYSYIRDYVEYCDSQFEKFRASHNKETILAWIELSYGRNVEFTYFEPSNFPINLLKQLRDTSPSRNKSEAGITWRDYLTSAMNELYSKLEEKGQRTFSGMHGALCDKYIFNFHSKDYKYNNVLPQLYPELFGSYRTFFFSESDKVEEDICEVVLSLESFKIYDLSNYDDYQDVLMDLDHIIRFRTLFFDSLKINYEVALSKFAELNEELSNSDVLDELFR